MYDTSVWIKPTLIYIYQDTTEVHLYCYDNTLLVLERRAVENMITSIINVNNFRLNIWNIETLGEWKLF